MRAQSSGFTLFVVGVFAVGMLALPVAGEAQTGGRVNNLKVLSDKIDDVTTPENIIKSFIKPGMSDAERSMALWKAAVKYRHQTAPPNEYLAADWEAHDPVKIFNVYGYCMCCCASSLIEALNRLDGRDARGRILAGHSVPEVRYGDAWHMYDCSLITLFPKPESGDLASVDDISQSIKDWYAANPEYKGNGAKLLDLMRSDGWMGWKEKGPALLANAPYNKMGYYPARTHGWDATMSEYNTESGVYEYGYELGHHALFALRPGESFERDAGNRGLHVNMEADPGFDQLKAQPGKNDLVYTAQFDPGYNGGVVANGYHRYRPDLAAGGLAAGADLYENLASGGEPALHLKAGGRKAGAVVQLSSPYVYLGGRVHVVAYRAGAADHVVVSLSTNNGRTFTRIWTPAATGKSEQTIKLGDRILRRYAYWLKIELESSTPRGAGIDALDIENDIQHAPRTLPWLGKGDNTITVAADSDSRIATRSIACRITDDPTFDKNETSDSMGLTFDNLKVVDGGCWWKGDTGSMTVPIAAPGDIVALRFGAQARVRDVKDLIRLLLSFDDGKSWTEAATIAGPYQGITRYFKYTSVPPGTRKALLKYEMTGRNTVGVLSFRVDADYRDPLAAPAFRPFDVVYKWTEDGAPKTSRTTVARLPFTYHLPAAAEPQMVSVSYEMPAK